MKDENAEKFNELSISISKLLITLSTGVILLSFTFIGNILNGEGIVNNNIIVRGWRLEFISLFSGVLFLLSFLLFYHNPNKMRRISDSNNISRLPLLIGAFQLITFLCGLYYIILFINNASVANTFL